jgi:2-polyprenyl-3-methyl-5-hydroxy-6-metoxy-1,4-benzoquinol methylase
MLNYDVHDLNRLKAFFKQVNTDIYPEPATNGCNTLILHAIDLLLKNGCLLPEMKLLDVGCGQGCALELFTKIGLIPVGVTIGAEDLQVCKDKGLNVHYMDQSFLKFKDHSFDFIWCRHCIEHSIFPYFTLAGFTRILKPEGKIYIEVPAPDTDCKHQTNPNHYSVLGKSMWIELLERSGFHIFKSLDLKIETQIGPDVYYAFMGYKK